MRAEMSEKQFELRIGGMTCSNCSQHVINAIEKVPGVKRVELPGWQSGTARVIAEEEISPDDLTAAVANAGYSAMIKAQRVIDSSNEEHMTGDNDIDFDLIVIGAGSGGFAAAITASDLGKQVAMIDGGTIGGTCVNIGCIPSKTLIRTAEAWYGAGKHPFRGANTQQVNLDWAAIRDQKDELVSRMRKSKYEDVLEAYPDITFISGLAAFQNDGSLLIGDRSYNAGKYVIATGARPRMIPIPGIEEAKPLNSTTLMDLDELPKSLIFLGGRAIALELGQTMARLGVEVLILQRSPRLVPEHEPEIGRAIKEYFEHEGIGVITSVQVERLSRDETSRIVHAKVMGQDREFRAEQIFMALGRESNTQDMGLKHVKVELDENGAIVVDEYQQTSNPKVYAIGDVTTNPEFVYVAAAGGKLAARNALTETLKPLDLSAMPAVIFTDPQIATVGLTEAEARSSGNDVQVSKVDLMHVPRALAARDTRGFIKLVADEESGRLLGAHVLAAEGGEVIQTATLAIKFGLTIDDLTDTLFPYLTQVEGLKMTAQAFTKDVTLLSCCA
jgi:mercuric reductase